MENQRETEEVNGVTFTRNADGSITLNGTASANTDYVFTNTTGASINNQNLGVGTYLLTGVTDGTISTYYLQMAVYDGTSTDYNSQFITAKTISVSTASTFRCYIVVKSGAVFNNKTIYPMLRLSSITDESYEQYTGGIPAPNPDFPMPIHYVTGNNTITINGKNVFNKNSNIIDNKYIGADGTIQNEALNWYQEDYIRVLSSTNYIMSSNSNNTMRIALYDENKNFISRVYSTGSVQVTTTATTKYIRLSGYNNKNDNIMLEIGSTASTYEPYQFQNVLIPLGNIEYCKIGNFADRLFKNVVDDVDYSDTLILGAWYIKKNIGKVTLNGTETWGLFNSSSSRTAFRYLIDDIEGYTSGSATPNLMLNRFRPASYNATWTSGMASRLTNSDSQKALILIYEPNVTVDDFKAWLSTHNTIVDYVLATPIYTQITGNLETALETANNQMLAYKSQTYISQINNDLPFIIDSTALKDLTSL